MKVSYLGLIAVSVLAGCSSKPEEVCPPSTRIEIPQAVVQGKNSGALKAIVLPVDMNFNDPGKEKLKNVFREKIESQIYATGTELIDRKIANKLSDEIKLAEKSGRYNTSGVPIADYAVLTEITTADFEKEFTEQTVIQIPNPKTGQVFRSVTPASCKFEVEVKAVVKVVTLPNMKLVDRFTVHGDQRDSTETRSSACPYGDKRYAGLVSKAADEALSRSNHLKQIFAPTATVVEMRQCETGNMVKISMGKNRNILPKQKMEFSSQAEVDNGDGTTDIETYGYGEGHVINNPQNGIRPQYSWVIIDDDVAQKVQKGDIVKPNTDVQCSLFDIECKFDL